MLRLPRHAKGVRLCVERSTIQKTRRQYRVPTQTTQLLQAMYDNTWSCTSIKSTLSLMHETHNGLQQGALSSPTSFKYYINDVITQLNTVNAST